MNKMKILTKGLLKENPAFVLVLGMCPSLAVTTSAINALGMGLATTFVLLMSNMLIKCGPRALIKDKNVIPNKVRIPAYIVVIATFVTIVDLVLKGFVPPLAESLGLFIPLIVVNCIVLGRAEAFASKNSVLDSVLDGIGMGLGFTLALFVIGSIREILGSGSFLGLSIPFMKGNEILVFVLAPGAFIVLGFVMALVRRIQNK
mgnify:CR=1 FL=1